MNNDTPAVPKRRTRGPTRSISHRMADAFDASLFRMLQRGGDPVIGDDGKPALDGEGEVVRKPIGVGYLKVIAARLRDLRKSGELRPADPVEEHLRKSREEAIRRSFQTRVANG